jgi:hypothetical protein
LVNEYSDMQDGLDKAEQSGKNQEIMLTLSNTENDRLNSLYEMMKD